MSICKYIYDFFNFDIEYDYRLKRQDSDLKEQLLEYDEETSFLVLPQVLNHIDNNVLIVHKLINSYAEQKLQNNI